MATNLNRTGFLPFSDSEGGAPFLRRVKVASNNGTAIFMGDCVTIGTAGNWTLATPGAGVSGSSVAAEFFDTVSQSRKGSPFLPAATTYTSTAFDTTGFDTDQSFIFVTGSPVTDRFVTSYSGSTPALTDLTKEANFLATAGSTANGLSGHTLNQATIAASAALDFRIEDILRNVLSDPTQTGAGVLVQINATSTAGVPDVTGNAGA